MVGQQGLLIWCVGHESIIFVPSQFLADELHVRPTATGPHSNPASLTLKLARKGSWELPLAAGRYRLTRQRKLFQPSEFELRSSDGELVLPSERSMPPRPVPNGSICGRHADAHATVTCARCGTFCCTACAGADRLHCRACAQRTLDEYEAALHRERANIYFTPAIGLMMLGYVGGVSPLAWRLVGIGVAASAGVASVAVARRARSTMLKLLVALLLYALSGVVWLWSLTAQ